MHEPFLYWRNLFVVGKKIVFTTIFVFWFCLNFKLFFQFMNILLKIWEKIDSWPVVGIPNILSNMIFVNSSQISKNWNKKQKYYEKMKMKRKRGAKSTHGLAQNAWLVSICQPTRKIGAPVIIRLARRPTRTGRYVPRDCVGLSSKHVRALLDWPIVAHSGKKQNRECSDLGRDGHCSLKRIGSL